MGLKIGDKIVYMGYRDVYGETPFRFEVGVIQDVIEIFPEGSDIRVKTKFSDTGEGNTFCLDSRYYKHCIIINLIEYENGIPLIWEDLV